MSDTVTVKAGSVVRIVTTGGGGWGDALKREVDRVVYDVQCGLVSRDRGARALRRRPQDERPEVGGRHRSDGKAPRRAASPSACRCRCSTAGPISRSSGSRARCGGRTTGPTPTPAGWRSGDRPGFARSSACPERHRTKQDVRALEIKQSFTVARPSPQVWALFQDVPVVAGCMPGAELLADKGDGAYQGRVSMKLGPFSAAFEGEAQVTPDPATHSGHVEGKGTDKRGGSRSKLVLDYRLAEVPGRHQGRRRCRRPARRADRAVRPYRHRQRDGERADPPVRAERRGEARGDAGCGNVGGKRNDRDDARVNGVCPHLHPRRLRPWRCRPLRKGHRGAITRCRQIRSAPSAFWAR